MAGINATTGELLEGFAHVEQSIAKLVTTPVGERVMREWVGNPGTRLLGETATPSVILRWATILWALIELFEPRFKVLAFLPNDLDRLGAFDLTIVGEYRPFAHLSWVQAKLFISVRDGVVTVGAGN